MRGSIRKIPVGEGAEGTGNAAITGVQPDGRAAETVPRLGSLSASTAPVASSAHSAGTAIPGSTPAYPISVYLLSQPGDVLHLPATSRGAARAQRGVELGQDLGQQRGDVGVQGTEPGVGRGCVPAPQHQHVPAVRRVQLDQPVRGRGHGPEWDISTWLSEPLPVPGTANWLHWSGASTVHFHLPGLLALILRQRGCQGSGREHGIALALAKPSGLSLHSSVGKAGGHGLSDGQPPAAPRVSMGCRVPHTGTGGQTQSCPGGLWGAGSPIPAPTGSPSSPVFQVGHAEVPGGEAHLEGDHLAVTGALVLGGP